MIFDKIVQTLKEHDVSFEHLTHDHVHRSEDAAKIRGNTLAQAAKALVLKEKKEGKFFMFIVGGDRKLDLKIIKKDILKAKNVSLAPPDQVLEKTSCTIGSVPPVGPLFNFPTYIDQHFTQTQEVMVFSAGTHNDSIKIKTKDFIKVFEPSIEEYSKTGN